MELNVEEQCLNIMKTTVLQKTYLKHRYPIVHGWVFDIRTGELIDMNFDFEQKLKDIQDIYDLRG